MSQSIDEGRSHMEKAIQHLRDEFSKLRVGRASTSMVSDLKVDAYGSTMTLKEVAALTTPDAKTIAVQPWDTSLIGDIERGILAANLGLTPSNDGKIIRLILPPVTEERRKDFVKELKKYGEEAKVAIRNIRRQSIDKLKENGASEDEQRSSKDAIQKVTDEFVKQVDSLVTQKSEELTNI